jgi:hypothetical protein
MSFIVKPYLSVGRGDILLTHTGCFRFHRPLELLKEGRDLHIKAYVLAMEGDGREQGVTKRCRLSCLTNSALLQYGI